MYAAAGCEQGVGLFSLELLIGLPRAGLRARELWLWLHEHEWHITLWISPSRLPAPWPCGVLSP